MSTPGEGWRLHERWLRTALESRLRDGHAVDEVLQEVALAACSPRAATIPTSAKAPWLYQVAIRQAAQYLRKQGRRQRHERRKAEANSREQSHFTLNGGMSNPLHWLLAQERNHLVRDAVTRLPPKDAEILMLKYTEDWSYGEIAAHLGLSESAVESRLHRARTKLRAALQQCQVGEEGPPP